MTKKEIVELDDELDERFRKTIADTKGLHKGVIKEAFEEAVRAWIEKNKGKKP
jgi:regulator of replication initiation timing